MFTETSREVSGRARAAGEALAQFFFPSRCLACRSRPLERLWRGGVCEHCWGAVEPPPEIRCARCDEPLDDAADPVCGRCLLDPPAFSGLRAAAPYRGSAREILLAFKFRGADYLAGHLARLLCSRLPVPDGVGEVAAVPATHRSRRRADHGAELLGAAVAGRLRLPFGAGRLEKVRETERQSGLPLSRRERNVRGAFRARAISAGGVLLVDDVVTSGATARECARRLRAAGAANVYVWCFARASRGDVDWGAPGRGPGQEGRRRPAGGAGEGPDGPAAWPNRP